MSHHPNATYRKRDTNVFPTVSNLAHNALTRHNAVPTMLMAAVTMLTLTACGHAAATSTRTPQVGTTHSAAAAGGALAGVTR